MMAKNKLIWIVLAAIICTLLVVSLFLIRKNNEPDVNSKLKPRKECKLYDSELPALAVLTEQQSFTIFGDTCVYMLSFAGYNGSKPVLKFWETPLKFKEYQLTLNRTKYLKEGLYVTLISSFPSGIRIAVTTDGQFNITSQQQLIASCFYDQRCKFYCDDFSGVYVKSDEKCPTGTLPLSKTALQDKFMNSSQVCCLNYLRKPMVLTTKKVFYNDEYFRLYYIGDSYHKQCVVKLIDPYGNERKETTKDCVSFRPLLSFSLINNIGEVYGNWRVSVELQDKNKTELKTSFDYLYVPMIYTEFELGFNSSKNLSFLSNNYYFKHLGGCGGSVSLLIGINNKTRRYLIKGGSQTLLRDGIYLIMKGAQCSYGKVILRLRKVANPVCPNRYCESGETLNSCPWDCLNTTHHATPITTNIEKCNSGCYYNGKCLLQQHRVIINNTLYDCIDGELVMKNG